MITPTRIEQVAIYLEGASEGDEAFYRSAASRYYYAIYHMLIHQLEKQGKPLMKAKQGGMHEDLLFSAEQAGGILKQARLCRARGQTDPCRCRLPAGG